MFIFELIGSMSLVSYFLNVGLILLILEAIAIFVGSLGFRSFKKLLSDSQYIMKVNSLRKNRIFGGPISFSFMFVMTYAMALLICGRDSKSFPTFFNIDVITPIESLLNNGINTYFIYFVFTATVLSIAISFRNYRILSEVRKNYLSKNHQ